MSLISFFSFFKVFYKNYKEKTILSIRKLKSKWESYDAYKKVDLEVFLNYCITALCTTIMISFFLYWIQEFKFHSFISYIFMFIANTIFIILYEHYFRWHMRDWKNDPYEQIRAREEAERLSELAAIEAKAQKEELEKLRKGSDMNDEFKEF